jgi:hypothetical protein
MKNLRLLGLAFAVLLFASPAFADINGSITLSSNFPGDYVSYGGEWVGPYPATITMGSQKFDGYLACLDLGKSTYVGTLYAGVWSTDYNDFNLKEASWLTDHLYGLAPTAANRNVVGQISFAIWTVMNENPPTTTNLDSFQQIAVQGWFQEAAAAVQGGYKPDSPLFTPDITSSQRFMTPVPIPSALWLLGSGLVGLVSIRRRMR